ncbi:MAG: DUF4364 family protein [Clostridiales bacterium]|nr:DUF4364 family protein [Candidatus Apopatousia equi]
MISTDFVADTTVNKLILLFVLDKMEIPLTENSIIDICTNKNDWLNYMDCKDVMWQLIDVNFIYKTIDSDDECRYNITVEGRNCLSHFFLKIPTSLREDITNFAKNNRMNFKRAQEYVGKYVKTVDGFYLCTLQIKDPLEGKNIFEIKIQMPTNKLANSTCKKWKEKAPLVYENMYELLTDENK